MDLTTEAWLWLYAGAFLMLAEIVSPGFVVFFFGLAAVSVAGVKALWPGLAAAGQAALFSFFCVMYLVVLRRFMKRLFRGEGSASAAPDDSYSGRIGRVTGLIRPGVPGRVMVGDAEWTARADEPLEVGDEVTVVRQENLTLTVKKITAA